VVGCELRCAPDRRTNGLLTEMGLRPCRTK
jgi:hypothetical protein